MGLSLARLRSFVAVADEGQFRRAAERLGLSQPALSAQIRELEAYLGVALFSRTTRNVRLSAAGELFLARIRKVLADLDGAVLELRDQACLRSGLVSVAATPSLASRLLPGVLLAFGSRHPGVRVRVFELDARVILSSLAAGEADLALAPRPPRTAVEIGFEPLARDPFVGLVAAGHPLAGRGEASLAELVRHPVVTTVEETSIRETLARACLEAGLALEVAHALTQHHTIVELVALDLGVAILPTLSLPDRLERVTPLRISGPPVEREVGLLRRRGEAVSAAAAAFAAIVRESAGALAARRLPGQADAPAAGAEAGS
ncbi:LysR family transcriptional regulator [Propylenella binzhouense]|uniref:LysR family transcriptional regulator n=1 Tax=Propylenella binzhouense TaxID=2555902 RepID=A0A964WV99_9HYPH|nr:LysR family transcriptional regulator [Propylenella binzhouense]MYZ49956.1 LysR family transcriptional regulator [Propylenella binzhouense]